MSEVRVNWKKKRFEWNPKKLKYNIFEMIASLSRVNSVTPVGEPYRIGDDEWAWDFVESHINTRTRW